MGGGGEAAVREVAAAAAQAAVVAGTAQTTVQVLFNLVILELLQQRHTNPSQRVSSHY